MGRKKRLKVSETCEANDHISKLHDDILCSVLSLLPLTDAVRTSVLSTRWRNLWKHIPHLNINDDQDLHPRDQSFRGLDWKLRFDIQRERARKFIKVVNRILNSRMSTGLATLKLNCCLHEKHSQKIDRWISFAISSGIKELHLQLDEKDVGFVNEAVPYEFPFKLFSEGRGSSVTCIALQYCTFRPPLRCDGLKSLKVLSLENVFVTEVDMQNILSGYALERLDVAECMRLSSLQCSQPCLQLKYLNITACPNLMKVELSAPNLFSFEYNGHLIEFTFNNSPKLKRAGFFFFNDIDDASTCSLTRIHGCSAMIEFLFVTITAKEVNLGCSNKFAHLKHLILEVLSSSEDDLLPMVASILKAAPVLNTLELQLTSFDLFGATGEARRVIKQKQHTERCQIRRLPECPHAHLRTVRINGFIGLTNQIELAIYILSNSMVLKLMTVDSVSRFYKGEVDNLWISVHNYDDFARRARKLASKFLPQEVSAGAKLVIS